MPLALCRARCHLYLLDPEGAQVFCRMNELVTASFMVMVLRKANIIFGCIKSILYKIRGGGLFFITLMHTAMRHLVLGWEGGAVF